MSWLEQCVAAVLNGAGVQEVMSLIEKGLNSYGEKVLDLVNGVSSEDLPFLLISLKTAVRMVEDEMTEADKRLYRLLEEGTATTIYTMFVPRKDE